MLVTVLVAICFASGKVLASGLDKPFYALEDAEYLFRDFVIQYEKVYDRREYFERLEIFKKSLQVINSRNEQYPMTVFKVNHFADLKPQELKQYRGLKLSNETIEKVTLPDSQIDPPEALDWRDQHVVSHVKDQGQCGSCYIFSAMGNIEGQYAIKHKQCLALSEGQAIDCLECGTCGGGIMFDVMNEFSSKPGIEKEEDYAYAPAKNNCHEDPKKVAVKVTKAIALQIADEEDLKKKVADIGPLAVALDASDFDLYHKGILEPASCTPGNLNHGITLVGYGEEKGKKFWIIKNSWGENWGEGGYVRLRRGVGACGIGTDGTATAEVE